MTNQPNTEIRCGYCLGVGTRQGFRCDACRGRQYISAEALRLAGLAHGDADRVTFLASQSLTGPRTERATYRTALRLAILRGSGAVTPVGEIAPIGAAIRAWLDAARPAKRPRGRPRGPERVTVTVSVLPEVAAWLRAQAEGPSAAVERIVAIYRADADARQRVADLVTENRMAAERQEKPQ